MTQILDADIPVAEIHDMTDRPHYFTASLEGLALQPGTGRNIVEHYWAATLDGRLLFCHRYTGLQPLCSPFPETIHAIYPRFAITLVRNVFVPDIFGRHLFTPLTEFTA